MADNPSPKRGISLSPNSSEQAPFIYFDGVATYGSNNGVIQIELGASALIPEHDGSVRTDVLITAHLRSSRAAAMALAAAIRRALDMPVSDQIMQPVPPGKAN